MPLYILYHDVDALTIEEKQKVAKGITNAHVQATGIAPFLVKVVLHSSAIGELYTGGEIDRKTLRLVGNVRKRTDVERKRELFRLHYENLRAVIPDPDYNIRIQLQEIDHDNITLDGAHMPEPGSEEERRLSEAGRVLH
ncbi:hypothetical protein FIBSPDRAFT_902879 [Athelia psychrophila]|uniref:Tautomerase cis-CaaD-like domain-containing protein n=1 Tax=Athelia psychrophila TaxID=1759441 RepID=A0A167WPW6_9AGAM|nr:hypothetical protein FIBSPDRAFT_902879 [Fibularhizoctonia sp. CBS 109695]